MRGRESAGITARDTARLLGTDPAKVSHIEAGRLGVSEERLRRLASFYECGDTALIDSLVAMANGQGRKGWWEAYRGVLPAGLLDISELEHHATHLRTIQVTHVPGVFQTEEYTAPSSGSVIPALPRNELEARVAHRLERACVLHRDSPVPYEALIHEAALRMRFGGSKVAKAQLEHVQELSHLPHISVRVIPFTSDCHIGSGHAMLYVGGPVGNWTPSRSSRRTASTCCTRRRSWPTTAPCTTSSRRRPWTGPGHGTSSTRSPETSERPCIP